MSFHFDPSDPSFIEDPYPIYKVLRDEYPAYRDDASGCWIISRYQDVARILIDTKTFSSAKGNTIIDSPAAGRQDARLDGPAAPRRTAPRDHARRHPAAHRSDAAGAARAYSARHRRARIAPHTPMWSRTSGARFSMARSAACSVSTTKAADEAVDLAQAICSTPASVHYGSPLTPDGFRAVFDFLGAQTEKRKSNRGDDLISLLISAQEAGAPLDDQEIVANMTVVLLAGNASIGHYFTNLIYALWLNPDQRELAASDPAGWRTQSRRACAGTRPPNASRARRRPRSRSRTSRSRPMHG